MGDRVSILELRSVRGTGGGPEKTILVGAEQADRTRFNVTVCYIRDLRDEVFRIDERARARGVDYVEVLERHSFDPRIWHGLLRLVTERRIDIIHSHDYKTNALALLLARRARIIPLSTAHGYTGHSARERYLYYPIDKRVLARFPRVIAVSSELKDDLVIRGASAERITVVLNGIDPSAFRKIDGQREIIRGELELAPTDFVIGSVGRLERQKRFDLLFEASVPLLKQRPELRLLIVGDGSLRAELQALVSKLDIDRQCRLLGHRDDISALHHAFDLFVQSSEYEGTPNAVLEAMAMETPLIATDVGGTRELALPDVHALIVPKHDVPALRAAIDSVLADPAAARRRATKARQRIETELSFETRTRRVEAIYDELTHA